MRRTVEYFEEAGRANTQRTLELACRRAGERDVKAIVMASTRGYTAERALELCPHQSLIAVGGERDRFSVVVADRFQQTGKLIFIRELEVNYPGGMQTAFRRFSQGTKVAVQVVVAAVRAGLVEEGEPVIGIGGSSQGADTALVIRASWDFDGITISEVICMPV